MTLQQWSNSFVIFSCFPLGSQDLGQLFWERDSWVMIYDGDTENTSMNVKSSCTLMYSPQSNSDWVGILSPRLSNFDLLKILGQIFWESKDLWLWHWKYILYYPLICDHVQPIGWWPKQPPIVPIFFLCDLWCEIFNFCLLSFCQIERT